MSILLLIIFALATAHLASNVVSSAIALHGEGRPLFPELPDPTRPSWRRRAGALGREVGSQTLFRLLWPLGLLPEALPSELGAQTDPETGAILPRGPLGPRPVILIHGYGHNRMALLPLRLWLREKGFLTIPFDHSRDRGDIEDKARHLARRVDLLRQMTGAETVDLVGHSLGGLIARCYVEQLGGHAHVGRLVTLGTPHGGTGMGIFARGPVADQLLPGSPFIKSLAQSLDALKEVHYTAIAGELDTVVFPIERALLPGPHGRVILRGVGHNALLANGRAFTALRSALRGEALEARPLGAGGDAHGGWRQDLGATQLLLPVPSPAIPLEGLFARGAEGEAAWRGREDPSREGAAPDLTAEGDTDPEADAPPAPPERGVEG